MLNCSLRLMCLLRIWMFQQKWSCWLGKCSCFFWQTWFYSLEKCWGNAPVALGNVLSSNFNYRWRILFFPSDSFISVSWPNPFFSLINNLNGNIGEVACWKDVRTISFPGWIALLKKEYHPRKPSAEEDDYWKKKLHWSLWL